AAPGTDTPYREGIQRGGRRSRQRLAGGQSGPDQPRPPQLGSVRVSSHSAYETGTEPKPGHCASTSTSTRKTSQAQKRVTVVALFQWITELSSGFPSARGSDHQWWSGRRKALRPAWSAVP